MKKDRELVKQIAWLGGSFFAVGLLVGCGSKAGDEFVGEWASLQANDTRSVNIKREDDVFTASFTTRQRNVGGGYSVALKEPYIQSGSAVLKDGILYAQWVGTLVPIEFNKAANHLVIGSVEFKRTD